MKENCISELKKLLEEILNFHENEFKILSAKKIKVFSDMDRIILLVLAKSTKTLRALKLLADNGYGEDAIVLSRSLFEGYINVAYILHDDSVRRARMFIVYSVIKYYERLRELGLLKIAPKEYTDQFSDAEVNKLKEEREKYKEDLKKNKILMQGSEWSFIGIAGIAYA